MFVDNRPRQDNNNNNNNNNNGPHENEPKKNYFDFGLYWGISASTFALMLYYVTVFKEKEQFYDIGLEVASSKSNLLILGNFGLAMLIATGKISSRLIFGQLKAKEVDFLSEQLIISLFDTLFFLIMFRSDIDKFFCMKIAILFYLKCFHWLVQKRTDFLFQSPQIPITVHLRMFTLICSLFFCDLAFVMSIFNSVYANSYSVDLLFLLEYTLLLLVNFAIMTKYLCETYEHTRPTQRWAKKNGILIYVRLMLSFFELLVYLGFFGWVTFHHGFPLHVLRHLYHSVQTVVDRLESLQKYKQTNDEIDKYYPSATKQEIEDAETCPVCFHSLDEEARQVPCSGKHIAHRSCLRDWLEKSQTCPFCKESLKVAKQRQQQNAAQQQNLGLNNFGLNNNFGPNNNYGPGPNFGPNNNFGPHNFGPNNNYGPGPNFGPHDSHNGLNTSGLNNSNNLNNSGLNNNGLNNSNNLNNSGLNNNGLNNSNNLNNSGLNNNGYNSGLNDSGFVPNGQSYPSNFVSLEPQSRSPPTSQMGTPQDIQTLQTQLQMMKSHMLQLEMLLQQVSSLNSNSKKEETQGTEESTSSPSHEEILNKILRHSAEEAFPKPKEEKKDSQELRERRLRFFQGQ